MILEMGTEGKLDVGFHKRLLETCTHRDRRGPFNFLRDFKYCFYLETFLCRKQCRGIGGLSRMPLRLLVMMLFCYFLRKILVMFCDTSFCWFALIGKESYESRASHSNCCLARDATATASFTL